MRGFAKRFVVAGATAVLMGSGVADAGAATRVDKDREAEVRFELDGRELTLAIVDGPRFEQFPSTIEQLAGKRVKVVCGTTFQRPRPDSYVLRRVRWPADATSLTIRFRRDVSRRAKWTQYFFAILDGVVDDVASVTAYDAESRVLARDRGVNGSGTDCRG